MYLTECIQDVSDIITETGIKLKNCSYLCFTEIKTFMSILIFRTIYLVLKNSYFNRSHDFFRFPTCTILAIGLLKYRNALKGSMNFEVESN